MFSLPPSSGEERKGKISYVGLERSSLSFGCWICLIQSLFRKLSKTVTFYHHLFLSLL